MITLHPTSAKIVIWSSLKIELFTCTKGQVYLTLAGVTAQPDSKAPRLNCASTVLLVVNPSGNISRGDLVCDPSSRECCRDLIIYTRSFLVCSEPPRGTKRPSVLIWIVLMIGIFSKTLFARGERSPLKANIINGQSSPVE